jgi:hypothetical protein
MKTLLLLGCALCLGACGDGGGTGTSQAPLPTGPQSQTPQAPLDSVPPMNSQSPALNDQAPPMNSQAPSLVGNAPKTCTLAFAILRNAGCDLDQDAQAQCEAAAVPGTKCFNELQAFLSCNLASITCNDSGDFSDLGACAGEFWAYAACEDADSQNPPSNSTGCTTSDSCSGCATNCTYCRCMALLDPSLTSTCDTLCAATTN